MIGLPPLPNLQPSTGDNTSPVSAPSVGKIALSVLTGGASDLIGGTKNGFSLQSIVAIILGLLLIAAGIFSFREVRQTVISTGKTAVKAAAL